MEDLEVEAGGGGVAAISVVLKSPGLSFFPDWSFPLPFPVFALSCCRLASTLLPVPGPNPAQRLGSALSLELWNLCLGHISFFPIF